MQTHPDIGLVIADFLQLVRFWLCTALLLQHYNLYYSVTRIQYIFTAL